jgi:hypothetical protein
VLDVVLLGPAEKESGEREGERETQLANNVVGVFPLRTRDCKTDDKRFSINQTTEIETQNTQKEIEIC